MNLLESLPGEKLTRDEENRLSKKIQASKGRDQDSINDLVLHNMREGFLYMKKVCNSKLQDDEIFSLCYTELVRSAKRFRTGYCRFFAFSKPGLRGAMTRYWGTKSTVKNGVEFVSLDSNIHSEDLNIKDREIDDECRHKFYLVKDTMAISSEPEFELMHLREQLTILNPLLKSRLTTQEYMIMDLIYLGGFNFQEVAELLDVSRPAAQFSHNRAMRKIRLIAARNKQLL